MVTSEARQGLGLNSPCQSHGGLRTGHPGYDPPPPVRSPALKHARRRVATMWSNDWTRDRRAKLSTGDHTAYDFAILTPPDGTNHPLWNAATKKLLGFPPSYTRHPTTTAFRLAVGHAFISTYARRHRPDLPVESHRCLCGWWDRSRSTSSTTAPASMRITSKQRTTSYGGEFLRTSSMETYAWHAFSWTSSRCPERL